MTEEDVGIELSCISEVVAGTLLETEVTGMDHAICTDVWDAGTLLKTEVAGMNNAIWTDVWAGGGKYGTTASNWLL